MAALASKTYNKMKRYRVISIDLDTRAFHLSEVINESWEEKVKEDHKERKKQITKGLISALDEFQSDIKIQNFIELGDKQPSVLAFHNRFFEQIRIAFFMGAYYPALTGACALGERILNHLILILRDDFKETDDYKKVYRKNQFDDWKLLIRVLDSWGVLLPKVVESFEKLHGIRNDAIHFRPETDRNDRPLSLSAIKILSDIISEQFPVTGIQPWFFSVPGESYIKEEWRNTPFVQKVYIPNSVLVGPYHVVESIRPEWKIRDDYKYGNKKVTDDEFIAFRQGFKKNGQKIPSRPPP